MTLYEWPRTGRREREDDRRGRRSFNAGRGTSAGGRLTEPGAGELGPLAAPGGAADLWAPIGPSVVLGSDEAGNPRVTGRVNDVWVEPAGGRRAYAAAATGGVWYTDDGGATWRALGGWRSADPNAGSLFASPLTTGCLLVEFHDDPADDEVWVGTGEGPLALRGTPGAVLPGVGVLHAVGPSTKPATDPVFTGEATNLLGAGIYRLARQPGGTGFAAATTKGLFERPSGSGPQLTWITATGVPTGSHDAALPCTDVVWTPPAGAQLGRLWAALFRPGGEQMELWWRAEGSDSFTRVTLPSGAGGAPPTTRFSLAASPSGDTVWVLGEGPRVWRIDATVDTPAGLLVGSVPPNLWGGDPVNDSKVVLAVDPSNTANIALGGTTDAPDAALFIGAVTGPPAGPLAFTLAGAHRGQGVHVDLLAIRFTTDGTRVWVACDGGVFVSSASGGEGTFVARNTGLPVVEAGFVACHPTNDAALVLGAQDNATQRRVGETIWRFEQGGDGGGVAFDQVDTHRYVAQNTRSDWSNGPNPPGAPVRRSPPANWDDENKAASFYSAPATIANGAVNQLAVGTNRVWFTTDWGANWVTLPNGVNDPRSGPVNKVQDVLPADGGAVRVLRWATVDRLWVLCKRGLSQMQRDGAGHWSRADVSLEDVLHPAKSTDVASSDTANDIAVHDPARGPFGSLYLAMLGDLSTDDDDLLWWWDGSSEWHKTGLATKTTAAALAVAVEPGHLDTVYVGTAIGVFRATIAFNGDGPSWPTWTRLDNGLPDVAVQDLAVFSQGPIRLLRAATQARGVWELDLSGPVADRTYVRVHQDDTRRTLPTPLAAPFEAKIADPADATKQIDTSYRWHASPDLRVHPKLGPMAAPTSLPWTQAHPAGSGGTPDRFAAWKLWRFQTALRREDLRSEATGVWDGQLDAVLRANGVPTPGGTATITKVYWESKVTGPNLDRLPWDTPRPSEADLVEYLPAETNRFGDRQPSVLVPRGVLTCYVMLHHRGASPAAASDVGTTLLYRVVPSWQTKASTAWLPGAVGWTAAIASLLTDGTAPVLPAGWVLADTGTPRHSPADEAAAGAPAVATFDVDLGTVKDKTLVLLVAVVHSANDHVSLTELPLRDLTLASPHVAVRSVLVRT
jgi:hypothetical protein